MITINDIMETTKILKERIHDFWDINRDICEFPPHPDQGGEKIDKIENQMNYNVADDIISNEASISNNNYSLRSEKKIVVDKYFKIKTKQNEVSDLHFKNDLKEWLSYEKNEFKEDESTQLEWNNFKAKANSIVYADQDTVDVDADEAIKKIEKMLPNRKVFVDKYFFKFRKHKDLSFIKF